MNVRLLEILRQRTNIQQLEEKRKKKRSKTIPRSKPKRVYFLFIWHRTRQRKKRRKTRKRRREYCWEACHQAEEASGSSRHSLSVKKLFPPRGYPYGNRKLHDPHWGARKKQRVHAGEKGRRRQKERKRERERERETGDPE